MAGTYAAYKTDEKREREGVLLDMGDAGKFRIARAGGANSNFQRRLMALSKPYRRAIQTGNIDPKIADRVLVEAYVETVLLGWESVTGPDGKPLEYSKENAVKLFTDLPDLFKDIRETAEDMTLFKLELDEADAGNSSSASATH
jgi:hypothetical protein